MQLYVADLKSSEQRPPKELKAFAKINLLPCENQQLAFTLDWRAFTFYDPYVKDWVVEPGEFEILVGSSSRDIRMRAKLMIEQDCVLTRFGNTTSGFTWTAGGT